MNSNNTQIDLQNGIDLNTILNNNTDLKCSIGDTLEFNTMNKKGVVSNRSVVLGHHFFLGFQYKFVTNSEIEVTEVYTNFQGGNNFNSLTNSMRITAINGTTFDQATGITPEYYLYNLKLPGKVNLTQSSGDNITIHIDYFPLVYGAFRISSFLYRSIF